MKKAMITLVIVLLFLSVSINLLTIKSWWAVAGYCLTMIIAGVFVSFMTKQKK